jgi:Ca2+-binding RTX toxin-like protein
MLTAIITNAAGPTELFFHEKGVPREESASETRLELSARIVDGPFKGERSTTTFIGRFDLETGFARVSEVRETVDGRLHFLLAFDRPVPIDAVFLGEYFDSVTLTGNRFSNVLVGDRAADRLVGNAGADTLVGLRGADTLVGGFGGDRFVFQSIAESTAAKHDTIRDFGTGADLLDLWAIDADSSARGNQAFDFLGTDGFTANPGELRRVGGGGHFVLGDTDGDGSADLVIRLLGRPPVAEDDFIL